MELLQSEIAGSVVQIGVFGMIPVLWWMWDARKREPFNRWLGLRDIEVLRRARVAKWTAVLCVLFAILGIGTLFLLRGVTTAISVFAGMGLRAVPAVMVYAVLHTSLPEEMLFRGFLLKRMAGPFGFAAANIVQAALFGLLHGALFFAQVGAGMAVVVTVLTGAVAWAMGYINEKLAGGSILPGWAIHAASNLVAGLAAAFSLV